MPEIFTVWSGAPEAPCWATSSLSKETTWRWYGPPSGVRVVSALAMFCATMSRRVFWASRALAVTSIPEIRFSDA
jgi:hypothetical protein